LVDQIHIRTNTHPQKSVAQRFYNLVDCAASGPFKKIDWRALDDILELNSDKLIDSGIVRMFVLADF